MSLVTIKPISTLSLYWHFFISNLAFVVTGKLRLKNGDLPRAGHHIASDFCGVAVAASSAPTYPAYLIAQLNALNIKQVRLDFTYGDFETHTGRLLDILIAEKFNVWLHIVQPSTAASRMSTSAEQARWAGFVGQIVNVYGDKVSVIEIGSTINRVRWAGYSLTGFFTTWRIAHSIIKAKNCMPNIILAGPNITDFEPIYNIGLLSLMAKYQVLPDIHTDNLFAERSTEPERFDHKIAGRRLAYCLRYNLIKKSHLLQKIAQNYSLQTASPSAFWTLPRIERILPNAEQKQADYLTRYLVLTAASGLKSAYWGPLICHREGLIDEGDFEYPTLERITLYASARGEVANYRLRPAFVALKTFQANIPNSQYLGRLNSGQDLEIHAFKRDNTVVHVAWTINGHVAKLTDCYAAKELGNVRIYAQAGALENSIQLISESPIYLVFPEAVSIKEHADLLPNLVINSNIEKSYFWVEDATWHGMMIANNQDEANSLFASLHPNKLATPNKASALRHARNAIWAVANPLNESEKIVVKKPVRMHWHKQVMDKNKPSKARRSWNGACELLRRDVDTAKPIGFIEAKQNSLFDNYYFCGFVAGDLSVRDAFSSFAKGDFSSISKESLFPSLVDFVQKMHNRGVFFRDLSGGNVLINKSALPNKVSFSLIDTARLYAYNYPLNMADRLSDLSRLCNKLNPALRNEFMQLYCKKIGRDFGAMQKVPFIIYDAKVAIKRQFRHLRRALR